MSASLVDPAALGRFIAPRTSPRTSTGSSTICRQPRHFPSNQTPYYPIDFRDFRPRTVLVSRIDRQKAKKRERQNKRFADARAKQLAQTILDTAIQTRIPSYTPGSLPSRSYSEHQVHSQQITSIPPIPLIHPPVETTRQVCLSLSTHIVNPKLIPNRQHRHRPSTCPLAIHRSARYITRFGHLPSYRHSQLKANR